MIIFFLLFLFALLLLLGAGIYNTRKELPAGISYAGREYPAGDVQFLRDITWVDREGAWHLDHEIFDTILAMIQGAEQFILLDFFLFNDFAGRIQGKNRKLSEELTEALIFQKQTCPELQVVFITDPVNTVYGGLQNKNLDLLEQCGVTVVFTQLHRLRDSNIIYSPFWRLCIAPFGNGKGGVLANPFGAGRIPLRSYFRLLNFKANHRKVCVADDGKVLQALVTSANPHDASSAHGNVAVLFSGEAVQDLLATEQAVLSFSGKVKLDIRDGQISDSNDGPTVQILTEGAVKKVIEGELELAGSGDRVSLIMFYLSDRDVIQSLIEANQRGAEVRVLLDPNKHAFGLDKHGIPNRQVASKLVAEGIHVRWGNTHGEQLHSKMMLITYQNGRSFLTLGSANLTRRNLDDFNLETNAAIRGNVSDKVLLDAAEYFDLLWNNSGHEQFSVPYQVFEEHSLVKACFCRLMEALGVGTF